MKYSTTTWWDTFNTGVEYVTLLLQKDTSMEVQKAVAITVTGTAMLTWGYGIYKSAELATDVMGYSPQVSRRLAFHFFTSFADMFRVTPENVTDEDIDTQLSSSRGQGSRQPNSLIFDNRCQLNAHCFVRNNACKKGERNLMFMDDLH